MDYYTCEISMFVHVRMAGSLVRKNYPHEMVKMTYLRKLNPSKYFPLYGVYIFNYTIKSD